MSDKNSNMWDLWITVDPILSLQAYQPQAPSHMSATKITLVWGYRTLFIRINISGGSEEEGDFNIT